MMGTGAVLYLYESLRIKVMRVGSWPRSSEGGPHRRLRARLSPPDPCKGELLLAADEAHCRSSEGNLADAGWLTANAGKGRPPTPQACSPPQIWIIGSSLRIALKHLLGGRAEAVNPNGMDQEVTRG
ncbi:hypothetical protein NL676_024022 [Syzygium grande]|nr:hypothetical protein NL676_024022 [Syzygium grande]